MENNLKTYLQLRWNRDNHTKYQKYFQLWFSNLTLIQLEYFTKDMIKSLK